MRTTLPLHIYLCPLAETGLVKARSLLILYKGVGGLSYRSVWKSAMSAPLGLLRDRYCHLRHPGIGQPAKIHSHTNTKTSRLPLFCEVRGAVVYTTLVAHIKTVKSGRLALNNKR